MSGTEVPAVDAARRARAQAALDRARTWVVKVGSALLTADGAGLDFGLIDELCAGLAALRSAGHDVLVVSSGAVAAGLSRLGRRGRPQALHELQAAAAVGQSGLVQAWDRALQGRGLSAALVLLTHEDLADRTRYLNARSTLRTLLGLGVVPVINENDTVVDDEIRFGDNDTLAALVTNLVEADVLAILTDQQGLHEDDPRRDPGAPLIRHVAAADPRLEALAGAGGHLGRGGMVTKVRAARLAARSGAVTLIAHGRIPGVLPALRGSDGPGTLLTPAAPPLLSRKRWIAGQLTTRGRLVVDSGAVRALVRDGRSLLPVGVVEVHGTFRRGDAVVCCDGEGQEIARGLVNYDARDARRIRGLPSRDLEARLGFVHEPEMIHRNNLVLS